FECRNRARERVANRTLRGAGARAAQLCPRSHTDGPAGLARGGRDDPDRNDDGVALYQHRAIRLVRWRAVPDGLPALCDDALSAPTPRRVGACLFFSSRISSLIVHEPVRTMGAW